MIIARLTSSRLPRKQLRLINGIPLIQHIVERISKIPTLDQICLATGPQAENQNLADFLAPLNVQTYFDDDVDDVTGRIARAAQYFNANFVITISGDCPLVDADFLAEGIDILTTSNVDYVTVDKDQYQCLHEGLGFHTQMAWQRLDELSTTWSHKEHAGSVIYEKPELFTRGEIVPRQVFRRQDMRISVDTQADLDFMNRLYAQSGISGTGLELSAVVKMVDADRSILELNKHVHQKTRFEQTRHFAIISYASKQLGMGHLSRSLALARELKESISASVIFVVNDDAQALKRIKTNEFQTITYTDLSQIESLLKTHSALRTCEGLIVDLRAEDLLEQYAFLNTYGIPVTIIDVWPETTHDNILTIIPSLSCLAVKPKHKVYCGAKYVMLNRAITNLRQHAVQRQHILVTAGANGRVSDLLLQQLATLGSAFPIKVLVGPYSDQTALERRFQEQALSNYELIQDPPDPYQLYAESILAFSIYGVTTLELMALGVPQVVYQTLNALDKALVAELTAKKMCFTIADLSESNSLSLSTLLDDTHTLTTIGERCQGFIDSQGASRAAQLIANHSSQKEAARHA